jgi:hypothetical protein
VSDKDTPMMSDAQVRALLLKLRKQRPHTNPFVDMLNKWMPKDIDQAKSYSLRSELTSVLHKGSKIEPHIKPHAEKQKQFVSIAVKLRRDIDGARAELVGLGVNQLVVDDPMVTGEYVMTDNAGRLLRMKCDDALRDVDRWLHFNGPQRGAPKAFKTRITEELWDLCKHYGVSKKEFEELLETLKGEKTTPETASTSAITQSRRRAKTKGVGSK